VSARIAITTDMHTPRKNALRWSAIFFFAQAVLFAIVFAIIAISMLAEGERSLLALVFVVCSAGAMIEAWIFGRSLK
jgi:hypothetical protein